MVTKCVCYDILFSEMKRVAHQTGATTLEELQQHVEFGWNCQMCHPYVRLMLRTGRIAFDVINKRLTRPIQPGQKPAQDDMN